MNLLDMLLGSLTSSSSLNALSQNTGTNQEQTSNLVNAAIPTLLGALTNNASSQEGAQSLLNALGQHTETTTMAQQLANADTNDGNAIIQHILGNNAGNVIQSLAGQTGTNENQVSSLLSNIAPALMSGLSAATTTAQNSNSDDGPDFTDLLTTFGGADQKEEQASGGLLSGLFGGGNSGSNNNGGGLFGGLGNIFANLFGTNTDEKEKEDEGAFNGTNLLTSLLSLLK